MNAFYRRDEDSSNLFHASVHTRGPWDEGSQHGGPPSALLLHVLRRCVAQEVGNGFSVARLTTEFLRPVPIDSLKATARIFKAGKTAVRVAATLTTSAAPEREIMSASAVFLRRDPAVAPAAKRPAGYTEEAWPMPESVEPFVFPFFVTEEGYHRAIELRVVDPPWGTTPIRFWARPVVDLIEGEAMTPEEAVAVLADAESGMGPPLDPKRFTFVNPDLTIYYARIPRSGMIGLEIFSTVGDAGVGLTEARLRDAQGIFGRSAQSLVVLPR